MNTKLKIATCFFLFSFCAFLMAPSVITVIEKNADVSYFYNVAEEEKKDTGTEYKDIKELPYPKDAGFSLSDIMKENKEDHYYIQYNYDQYIDVVIPPPEYRI